MSRCYPSMMHLCRNKSEGQVFGSQEEKNKNTLSPGGMQHIPHGHMLSLCTHVTPSLCGRPFGFNSADYWRTSQRSLMLLQHATEFTDGAETKN